MEKGRRKKQIADSIPDLLDSKREERAWADRLLSALAGAMLLWMYLEPPFVMTGVLWREFIGGFGSYMALTSLLIASAPVAAYFAAEAFHARSPWDCAKWASWPTAILLVYHGVLSSVLRADLSSASDLGFIEFCNTGAWAGVFAGFFGGFAFQAKRRRRFPPLPWRERLTRGMLGALAVGLSWAFLGAFLDFSWTKTGSDPDMYLYFTLFTLLGLPFYIGALADALGDRRGELAVVWSLPPTFLALSYVLGGSSVLADPSQADVLLGRLPQIALAAGVVCGFASGTGFRR